MYTRGSRMCVYCEDNQLPQKGLKNRIPKKNMATFTPIVPIMKKPFNWLQLIYKTISYIILLKKIQSTKCTDQKNAPLEDATNQDELKKPTQSAEAVSDFNNNLQK